MVTLWAADVRSAQWRARATASTLAAAPVVMGNAVFAARREIRGNSLICGGDGWARAEIVKRDQRLASRFPVPADNREFFRRNRETNPPEQRTRGARCCNSLP